MSLMFNLKKDALIYSRKRKSSTRSILASVCSIFLALIVALLVATALGYNPVLLFTKLFSLGFDDPSYLFYKFGVFALAGFAFYFAWKCGIINIGISGQMLAAGTVIVVICNSIKDASTELPDWLGYGLGQIFIIFLAIVVASAVAVFVGALQNYLRINAVVSAILLNWIIYFISFFVLATYFVDSEQFANSSPVPDVFRLYDVNNGTGAIIPVIIICVVIAIVMFVIFKFTVFGHKIKSIGLSSEASRFAGYNIKKLNIISFMISGAIAGILATVCYTSTVPAAVPLSLTYSAVPSEGFEGIMISLVGGNNPFGILAASLLFGLFEASSIGLPTSPSFNDVITGLVMLGSALSVIVIKWNPIIKLNQYKYDINYFETRTKFDNSMDSLLSKYHSIFYSKKSEIKNIQKEYKNEKHKVNDLYQQKIKDNATWLKQYNAIIDSQYDAKLKYINQEIQDDFEQLNKKYKSQKIDMNAFDAGIIKIQSKYKLSIENLNYRQEQKKYHGKYKKQQQDHKDSKAYEFALKNIEKEYAVKKMQYTESIKLLKKELLQKYLSERQFIVDTYNYHKVLNLINKKLNTQPLINVKSNLITNKYDNDLTKYINRLKNKKKEQSVFENLRTQAITKSNTWRNNQINKMIKKQNKIINNADLFQKAVYKIKSIIPKVHNYDYIQDLNERINGIVKNYQERKR